MSMCASASAARRKPLQCPADRQDVSPLGLNRSTRLIATATTLGPPKADSASNKPASSRE